VGGFVEPAETENETDKLREGDKVALELMETFGDDENEGAVDIVPDSLGDDDKRLLIERNAERDALVDTDIETLGLRLAPGDRDASDAVATNDAESKEDIDLDTRGEVVSHALIDDLDDKEALVDTDFEAGGLRLALGDRVDTSEVDAAKDTESREDIDLDTLGEVVSHTLIEDLDEKEGLADTDFET
jgi:hypothetical protein